MISAMSATGRLDATGERHGKAAAIVGPAIIGDGQRLCFTPCHHAPLRFCDGRTPPVPPRQVCCPRCGETWILEFPTVAAGEDAVAVWKRP
jgi:hypothetical protein